MRQRVTQGVSLAEAIVACFILTAAMAVSAALYHTALGHSVRIDRTHRACRAVERRLEEIRAWSRDNHGTNGSLEFGDWGSFPGAVSRDSEYPEFEIRTAIDRKDLFSPSSAFEVINFAAQADDTVSRADKGEKRQLADSSYTVTVEAKWGDGPKDHFVARTLLADPVKDYGWESGQAYQAVELTSAPAYLAPNARASFQATIKDARGRAVRNAVVQWYVDPKSSGKGTIETNPARSDSATFINAVEVDKDPDVLGDELTVQTGGTAVIVARVRLGGVEAVNRTTPIALGVSP